MNFFFHNDGTGKFAEIGVQIGAAYDGNGHELGSMGVDCADYDNDGRLDFIQTSYQNELPVLFHNLGDGTLEDVTMLAGAGARSRPYVKWGVGFVDFDNDGRKDLFIGCGHIQDNVELWDDSTSYLARPVLLRNTGDGRFADVTDASGDGLKIKAVGAALPSTTWTMTGGSTCHSQLAPRAFRVEERVPDGQPLAPGATPRSENQPRRRGGSREARGRGSYAVR